MAGLFVRFTLRGVMTGVSGSYSRLFRCSISQTPKKVNKNIRA